jgi:hypothetical protein
VICKFISPELLQSMPGLDDNVPILLFHELRFELKFDGS